MSILCRLIVAQDSAVAFDPELGFPVLDRDRHRCDQLSFHGCIGHTSVSREVDIHWTQVMCRLVHLNLIFFTCQALWDHVVTS